MCELTNRCQKGQNNLFNYKKTCFGQLVDCGTKELNMSIMMNYKAQGGNLKVPKMVISNK